MGFLGKLVDTETENRRMQNLRRKTENYNFVIQHVPICTVYNLTVLLFHHFTDIVLYGFASLLIYTDEVSRSKSCNKQNIMVIGKEKAIIK